MTSSTLSTPLLKRYLIKMWYLGENFSGSQRQPNLRTVEGEIIKALQKTKYIKNAKEGNFKVAARTDTSVNARFAAFCFTSPHILYLGKLDSYFPEDLGVTEWVEVPLTFNPRWEAILKEYRYILPRSTYSNNNLDLELMKEAIKLLEGENNFKLFSKTDSTKTNKLTVLTMEKALINIHSNHIRFDFCSKSFLWQQIRRTVSFLIRIGKHEKSLIDLKNRFKEEFINNKLETRDKPCNPEGLTLWETQYSKNIIFTSNEKCVDRKKECLKKHHQKSLQQAENIALLLQDI